MASFWIFFINNRAFTYFLTGVIILAGLTAVGSIPRENTPEVTLPIAIVGTSFVGASAEETEDLVTEVLENEIEGMSDLKEMQSVTQAGYSRISLEFAQGVDMDGRTTRLREIVEGARGKLPTDGNEPVVQKIEFSTMPVFTVSLVSSMPVYLFDQVVQDVQGALEQIDQVAQVNRSGIPEREIAVVVDQAKLMQYGIDITAVEGGLRSSSITLPGGSIEAGNTSYSLEVSSKVSQAEELGGIPLGFVGGSVVRLDEIGEVYNGYARATDTATVGVPGQETLRAVTFDVSKQKGGDITRLSSDIRTFLEKEEHGLLRGTRAIITLDAGKEINRSISDLVRTGAQTVLLVGLILLLGVGVRESLIAAVAIPLSFLLAFVAFVVSGNTINFISLFALILSIGILVDSAIVVVEGINRNLAEGSGRIEAAVETIREYAAPLVAGTLTTVAVFAPLLFLSGVTGEFIKGIPYTVIFVLIASIFVALGLLTTFAAGTLRAKNTSRSSYADRGFIWLGNRYRSTLKYCFANAIARRLFQGMAALTVVLSVTLVALGLVKIEFFPGGDLEYAFVKIELPMHASLEETYAFTASLEKTFVPYQYIETFVSTVGSESQFERGARKGDRFASITLNIAQDYQAQGEALLDDLKAVINTQDYPYAELVALVGGPPTGSAVDVSIYAENKETLSGFAPQIEQFMNESAEMSNVTSSLAQGELGLEVVVDRHQAAHYGISIPTIAQAIRSASDGVEVFDINQGDYQVPVVLRNRLDPAQEGSYTDRVAPNELLAIELRNGFGDFVPLSSVANIVIASTNNEITRSEGKRVVNLTADVAGDLSPAQVREQVREYIDRESPQGISYEFGGEKKEQEQSNKELAIAFVAGVFLMFAILIIQFGRWRQVMIILSILPYALAGVILGLFMSGNALSFPSFLGLIALSGIVVNNSIILVSVFNDIRKNNPGWSIQQIVVEGAVRRLRPILLTTITTIIGISPLLTQSALWAPIAYAIIFGLLFCSLITLGAIPFAYARLEGLQQGTMRDLWTYILHVLLLFVFPLALLLLVLWASNAVALGSTLTVYLAATSSFGLLCLLVWLRRKH